MSKTIKLGNRIVTYNLQRKKVKNINIRVKRDLTINVSANDRVTVKQIEDALLLRAEFILRAIEAYEKMAAHAALGQTYISGDIFTLFGKPKTLILKEGIENTAALANDTIMLTVKDANDFELKKATLQKLFDQICRDTVTELCHLVYPQFKKLGIGFPELKFKRMTSRWGSCHYQKGILTFNYSLVRAPVECIEYVVYHEFTHFLHPDHSPAFYKCLSVYIPDYKERKKLLNQTPIQK